MSDFTSRLPAHPSLEQLRKQAKELLQLYRSGDAAAAARFRAHKPHSSDPILADAQFVLAREYGFESWPKLVHHLEAIEPPSLEQHERLAEDLVAAYRSADAGAVFRLNELFHSSYDVGRIRDFVQDRLKVLPDAERRIADFALSDAQLLVARLYGFESWARFVESSMRPPSDPRSAPLGLSSTPPFYRIDWKNNSIEPRQPMSRKDWDRVFDVMKEMRLTALNANSQINDDVIERLAHLDHVTHLNLTGSKRVSDDGLKHLARMPQLQELDMSEYPGGRITDRGLEVLRYLPELRRFQMCWQSGISDAGVANLAFCDHLESVDLLGTHTGDGAINALKGKRNLRNFKTGRLVTDAGLTLLHQFPAFKTWQGGEIEYGLMSFGAEPTNLLVDGPFTGEGLASLRGLNGLFGLSFFWHTSALRGKDLKSLTGLPNLGFLGCQGELCDDEAMRHIGAIPQLRMLMGQGTVASDEGFAALSRSQTIEYIWGRECPNLKGRGFTALAAMPSLRGLAVSCKSVDDEALSTLPRFSALTELMPMDVPDEGFRHVGRCEQLESLVLMYCRKTTDIATGYIAGLSRLRKYHAGATQITDRSLEILGRMPSLERLDFEGCARLTNAGLTYLARLPRLREISVGGSPKVTREGMAIFPATVRASYE